MRIHSDFGNGWIHIGVFAGAVFLAVTPVQAHPHVFIDTTLVLEIDRQGQLVAVDVTWAYDDFYSLVLLEDRGLDSDFDGQLTENELGQLQGFDLQWDAEFAGDLYVTSVFDEAQAVVLGKPKDLGVTMENGQIVSRHRRMLDHPVPAGQLNIKAYDPSYYSSYELVQARVATAGQAGNADGSVEQACSVLVTQPNLNAAYSKVEELLYATPQEQAEEFFPEVGEAFSAVVRLQCKGI